MLLRDFQNEIVRDLKACERLKGRRVEIIAEDSLDFVTKLQEALQLTSGVVVIVSTPSATSSGHDGTGAHVAASLAAVVAWVVCKEQGIDARRNPLAVMMVVFAAAVGIAVGGSKPPPLNPPIEIRGILVADDGCGHLRPVGAPFVITNYVEVVHE